MVPKAHIVTSLNGNMSVSDRLLAELDRVALSTWPHLHHCCKYALSAAHSCIYKTMASWTSFQERYRKRWSEIQICAGKNTPFSTTIKQCTTNHGKISRGAWWLWECLQWRNNKSHSMGCGVHRVVCESNMTWKNFRHRWPFVKAICHGVPLTQKQWCAALYVSFCSCVYKLEKKKSRFVWSAMMLMCSLPYR